MSSRGFYKNKPDAVTKTAHCVGPWVVIELGDGHGITIALQSDTRHAVCHIPWKSAAHRHALANARLIAAAPVLLEALEEMTVYLEALYHVEGRYTKPYTLNARAALAQAKGETV